MNLTYSTPCDQWSSTEVDMCLGIVARLLFLSESPLLGRPSFAQFICSPTMRHEDLKDLGVDSLAWMALLTSLEDLIGIRFQDDLLMANKLSAHEVARVLAESLCGDNLNQYLFSQKTLMSTVSCGKRYLIIDDFLPANEFDSLRTAMQTTNYELVDSVVDPVVDGIAYRSAGTMLAHDTQLAPGELGIAIDSILRAIRNASDLYGQAGIDWSILSFAFWKYPLGSRLGWHNDAGKGRSGEFVLYLHEEWKPSWGGELMLLDRDTDAFAHGVGSDTFDLEAAVALTHAELTAIVPRPNRLVLVKAGTAHYINRVDVSAGNAQRCSLTGFASKRVSKQFDPRAKLEQLGALMGWAPKDSMP